MNNLKDNPVFTITAAILTRVILICHTLLVVWNVYADKARNPYWWLLLVLALPMIIELIVVVIRNGGHEWESVFCPSIFFYLISVLPSIWLLEIDEINYVKSNVTGMSKSFYIHFFTETPQALVTLSTSEWLMAIEQSTVFLLIFARWLLPTGHMTYSQLSNVLLLYIGTLADILELLEMFQLDGAVESWNFVYGVMSVFSLGLLQFTLVLVETPTEEGHMPLLPEKTSKSGGWTFMPRHVRLEVATILQSIVLMHIPVVCIRITAIAIYGIKLYSNVFFLIKNCLMLILNVNRMIILCFFTQPKQNTE